MNEWIPVVSALMLVVAQVPKSMKTNEWDTRSVLSSWLLWEEEKRSHKYDIVGFSFQKTLHVETCFCMSENVARMAWPSTTTNETTDQSSAQHTDTRVGSVETRGWKGRNQMKRICMTSKGVSRVYLFGTSPRNRRSLVSLSAIKLRSWDPCRKSLDVLIQ